MPDRHPVAIFGASGYSGAELLRLLAGHPAAEVVAAGAAERAGQAVARVYPHLSPLGDVAFEELDPGSMAGRAEFAFLALPHGASCGIAPRLLDAGLRVIDLAGDFRLPAEDYPAWYGFDHPAPEWLGKAVYGLPELFADQIAGADLVANPGCYPTAVALALAPLLRAGLIDGGHVVVDAKSRVSGAGTKATATVHYAHTEGSVRPYKVGTHQHTPEIEHVLGRAAGGQVGVTFVPHLVPAVRGVLVTCYAPVSGNGTTEAVLRAALADAYAGAPFVRVLPAGEMADSKRVTGSNVCEIGVGSDPRTGTAVVASAVDNLPGSGHGASDPGAVPVTVTYPKGFRAAGAGAGLKESGRLDLALLVADGPAAAAGAFTTNAFPAAPVILDRQHLSNGLARAVVVNSGQANAGTGPDGVKDAQATAEAAAVALGCATDEVLVCSTGVIGPRVPLAKLASALPGLAARLSEDGGPEFAEAMLTTDRAPKEATADAGRWRVGGCAKGAGMISPRLAPHGLATLLVFLTTDATLTPAAAASIVASDAAPVWNAVTVDGCQSTNDTVLLLASGAAGGDPIAPGSPEASAVGRAVRRVCEDLARRLVINAEGASKALVVQVDGARDAHDARRVGLAVAGSALVKTAVFGGDPNPGRILQAVGDAGAAFDPLRVRATLDGLCVVDGGVVLEPPVDAAAEVLAGPEVLVRVDLGAGEGSATVFGCDMGEEYVRINARYRT